MTRTAVITAVSGRHEHLRNQLQGIRRGQTRPDLHVVVAMNDTLVAEIARDFPGTDVVEINARTPLPVARARNRGAAVARAAGADGLVFLDVDCVPSETLVDRYFALLATDAHANALLCGQVNYVSRRGRWQDDYATLVELSSPHPARPRLGPDDVIATTDYDLFWSLSFGVTAQAWTRIGGFCESYTGYGGEDTDLAQTAATRGVGMNWIGGAIAYHQYHPVSEPPIEHLDDILRNAKVFHDRWERWPMDGWLRAFFDKGLIYYDDADQIWRKAD